MHAYPPSPKHISDWLTFLTAYSRFPWIMVKTNPFPPFPILLSVAFLVGSGYFILPLNIPSCLLNKYMYTNYYKLNYTTYSKNDIARVSAVPPKVKWFTIADYIISLNIIMSCVQQRLISCIPTKVSFKYCAPTNTICMWLRPIHKLF